LADSGTLFLDDIESLTLEMQAALLHLLETGHVMRLGSSRPIPVDVRIIGGTAVNLESYVADGRFHPHLYYRFGVFIIELSPLRDRLEDIPLLVERFLSRISQRLDKPAWISDEAQTALQRYPWPGNIRELEDVLERAVMQADNNLVQVSDLPAVVRSGRVLTSQTPRPQPVLTLRDAEREAIIRAAWASEGRVSDMARQLGAGRTTLWRKLKQLDINLEQYKSRE
jgi:transcriptional activator for dhaKLM operon